MVSVLLPGLYFYCDLNIAKLMNMLNNLSLLLNFHGSSFQLLRITRIVSILVRESHQIRCIREEIIHLLKWQVLCLRQQEIEEQSVRKIANDEDEIVSIANICHGNIGDLSNHGVEGKRDHCRNRDTLGTGFGVEDLSWNDPREWSAGCREGEVVGPGTDDESPRCGFVVRDSRRELRNQDASDEKADLWLC